MKRSARSWGIFTALIVGWLSMAVWVDRLAPQKMASTAAMPAEAIQTNISLTFDPEDQNNQKMKRALSSFLVGDDFYIKGRNEVVIKSDIELINRNDFAVKDLEFVCEEFASSGSGLNAKKITIHERVGRSDSTRVYGFNFGLVNSQTEAFRCKAVGFTRIASLPN